MCGVHGVSAAEGGAQSPMSVCLGQRTCSALESEAFAGSMAEQGAAQHNVITGEPIFV